MKYTVAASVAVALQGVGAALWHGERRGGTDNDGDTVCPNGTTCYKVTDTFWNCLPIPGPSGAITVSKDGHGNYTTIGEALLDTSSNVYYIYPGNYTEQVNITRPNVHIRGHTLTPWTYQGNTVTISRNMPAFLAGSNDLSGTVRVVKGATGTRLYNLNIENTYGKPVQQAQAIALSANEGQLGVYGSVLSGWQDTLLANKGTQFYTDSLIKGSVDFIFGMQASIWITDSELEAVDMGSLTASGRSTEDANWYVIDNTKVTGVGSTYLGRPWRNYARVIFQYCWLDANINPAGWSIWTPLDTRIDHTYYGEYKNSGPGAVQDQRVKWAQNMTSPVNITTVLGTDLTWIDPLYLKNCHL